ncbi:hypothetical protein AwPolaro_01860 [Polaromonas sp.]|nr:hypothetical protein AwPolaro_01860 [Polaromonas sp.]
MTNAAGFEKFDAPAQYGQGDQGIQSVFRDVSALDALEEEEDFKPLTAEEAQKVCAANPPISLWVVVAGQLGVGIVLALIAWLLTGQARMGWSAAYGALAVVLPAALFARGLSRQKTATEGNAALVGFFVWEIVKIALTVAMLVAAPRLVNNLSWLALLAGFVVTMKVYWVAMWFCSVRKESIKIS